MALDKYISVHQKKKAQSGLSISSAEQMMEGHKAVQGEASMTGKAEPEDGEDCEAGVRAGPWAELIPIPLSLGSHRRPQNVETLNPWLFVDFPHRCDKMLDKDSSGEGRLTLAHQSSLGSSLS